MKKVIIPLMLIIFLSTIVYADLTCQVETSSCSGGYSDILHMSNNTNAHAELANGTDYADDYIVCCMDTGDQSVSISASCSGGTNFLDLSAATDAHVEKTGQTDYAYDACIYSADAIFTCGYGTSCTGSQACLATISDNTDAHIADCTTNPYTTHVCCNMTYTNTPPTMTSISDNPDPIKGGATITITANGVADDDDDSLNLYCSTSTTPDSGNDICTGGTRTDSGAPYNLDCTFAVATDNAQHTVYCRVYDSEFYSSASSTTYKTDSTPPSAVSIQNVDGDSTPDYWDTTPNSQTIIQADRPDSGMLCRWSTSDVAYSSISSSDFCTMGVDSTQCNLGNLTESSSYTYHISCMDAVGNEQSTSENTDVSFGIDWSEPTTSVSGYGEYYVPGHNVTINEMDNVGTPSTILTWYCSPTTGCSPTTPIDNLDNVSFTNRGTNYIRWYSRDAADNNQAESEVTVEINSLPVITDSDMQYGIGSGDYTGKNGKRVYFYCDGTDSNLPVNGNSGYSAKIWLRKSGSGTWDKANGASMTWSAIDGRFQYDHLLDDADDIYGTVYDMLCEITDDLDEKSNHTKNSIFTVINTPPYADDITINDSSAQKFDWVRWYCSGADADTPTHQESNLEATFWLRTQGAGTWDKLSNVSMAGWDGTNHYYDYQIIDDGSTHYDAQCQFSDSVDSSTLYQEFETEYIVNDDWDNDAVSDSLDTLEGTGADLDTSLTVIILINGTQQNSPSGTQTVQFRDESDQQVFVEFSNDFDSNELLIPNIMVTRSSTDLGSVIVSGLSGISKTINVPKVLGIDMICVKDSEIASINEISSACNGENETMFNNCDTGGENISGIICTDKGLYYEVTGLTHSAATESGTSRLQIWSDGSYLQLDDIYFYANYTNSTNHTITTGDCDIWFTDIGWENMIYNSSSGLWAYDRIFTSPGARTYNVSCTDPTYTNLSLEDNFTILTSAILEFRVVTIIAAMLCVLLIVVLKRKKL